VINLKSKKKQNIVRVLFLLVLFFVGNYYLANLINNKVNREIKNYTFTEVDILRSSGYWNRAPLVIDDSATGLGAHNWTWAEKQPWCSGSGTFEEPYLIENVTIDGLNSGNCITIKNSDKYFRIENCTVFNSGSGFFDAGISLEYAGNGTLINNNCSFNNNHGMFIAVSDNTTILGNTASNNSFEGIYIHYSDNTTILGNTVNDNQNIGIYLYHSNSTTILGNTANNNSYYGIYVKDFHSAIVSGNTANDNTYNGILIFDSNNNTVSGNTASNNQDDGIYLYNSDSTTVSGNTANNNQDDGIYVRVSANATVSGNTASNNQDDGIFLFYSDNNTVSGNTASNNQDDGIYLYNSDSTTVSGNNVDNNVKCGINISESDYNLIYNNYFTNNGIHALDNGNSNNWNSSIIGNYWDNYAGYDDDFDGIGDSPHDFGTGIDYLPIWNFQSPIHIDDAGVQDWDWVKTQAWFGGGSGTDVDPYILKGLNINAKGTEYGIFIENSNQFFNLTECLFINSGSATHNAGIKLSHTNNSQISNCTSANNKYAGIELYYDCNNNTILNNILANNSDRSLYLREHSDFNIIRGNQIYNTSGSGIRFLHSEFNIILENEIFDCNRGIYVHASEKNTLKKNNIHDNTYGIMLQYGHYSNITENTISNNSYGIYYSASTSYCNFSRNLIEENTLDGIWIRESSLNNTILNNEVHNNQRYGIYFDNPNSHDNKFYLNEFIGNNIHSYDNGTNNYWDNGSIGNYWDDYTGVDANDDGIGDSPYIISGTAGSRDNFPIWADGDDLPPVITIVSPSANSVFGLDAPNYQITIVELNLDTIWYTLDGGGTNYTITGLTGTFNQLAWEALSEGNVIIRFYANDTAGNIGSAAETVENDIITPVITIISPLPNSVFGLVAPNYNISIDELNLDTIWYSLNEGVTIYKITDLTGTFNQLAWEALSEGSLTIRFYANDTAGNIGFTDVEVIIEIPEDIPDLPIISFGNYYILFAFIATLSFVILEKRKKK